MESPTQQTEAEPLSWEKSAAVVGPDGRELTARDTSSQLDEDHVCQLPAYLAPSYIIDISLSLSMHVIRKD